MGLLDGCEYVLSEFFNFVEPYSNIYVLQGSESKRLGNWIASEYSYKPERKALINWFSVDAPSQFNHLKILWQNFCL